MRVGPTQTTETGPKLSFQAGFTGCLPGFNSQRLNQAAIGLPAAEWQRSSSLIHERCDPTVTRVTMAPLFCVYPWSKPSGIEPIAVGIEPLALEVRHSYRSKSVRKPCHKSSCQPILQPILEGSVLTDAERRAQPSAVGKWLVVNSF